MAKVTGRSRRRSSPAQPVTGMVMLLKAALLVVAASLIFGQHGIVQALDRPSPSIHMPGPTHVTKTTKRRRSSQLEKSTLFNIPPGGNQNQQTAVPKQGAYGKIKIHKEPLLLSLILHPDEFLYAILLIAKNKLQRNNTPQVVPPELQDDLTFCNEILGKVSRSFATVIRQLPESLRIDVVIFYLVLRGLDTIEDEPTATKNNKDKMQLLKSFAQKALSSTSKQDRFHVEGVGHGDERRLLEQFPRVQAIYRHCVLPHSQQIIADITQRMGAGMAETVGKDLTQGTTNELQYNQYCHYVAGLVGEGLSRLFAASQLEESYFASELYLSDEMGLFLQKTNIIRDYLEDYVEGRTFWPQTIWMKHANQSQDLGYFMQNHNSDNAKRCLHDMIANALEHVPACLTYLRGLQCPSIFRFCAIPQVMAMATLAKCYDNANVFTGVVKIRKGLSAKLILKANTLDGVYAIFYQQAKWMEQKALKSKSVVEKEALLDAIDIICAITEPAYRRQQRAKLWPMLFVSAVVACQFVPGLTLVLLAMALVNYYLGPFLTVP
ncbi:Squalene synthase [Seminavis robusta]|uniref:Squalene synthase n=1 Tax=Seminavis robusta TaxID=568900 RepID=A0A9N8H1D7_9STRA|nr:Squalene synthase [Seminavis robusta]|eukprot:Sro2_g001880.1 Squalene synthase (550) ;mRNA; f:267174-268930